MAQIVVPSNQDGRLEVFGIDGTGNPFHISQTAPNSGWSPWIMLPAGYSMSEITAAKNSDGRLEVFCADNHGTVLHLCQISAGGGLNPNWVALGSGYQMSQIAVGQNQSGTLEVFCVDRHGSVFHMWQTSPGGVWSPNWVALGSGYQMSQIAVGRNQSGTLEVFCVDNHGSVFHMWQTSPGGVWSPNWAGLGSGYQMSHIAVGQNQSGTLEVFCVDRHGSVFHTWQTSPGGVWSPNWAGLGSGYQMSQIVVARNHDGRLEVFGVDEHGTALHMWQVSPGGACSPNWIGLSNAHSTSQIAVGQDADGRLEVFDLKGFEVDHVWQNDGWSTWTALSTEAALMPVTSVLPRDEPCPARMTLGAGYFDVPAGLLDTSMNTEGRLIQELRAAAQLRDGNKILELVAARVGGNYLNPGSTPQAVITAMTQLAVTGSYAFAAWSKNPATDLTSTLIQKGMPSSAAATASQQIMSDFNAALQAVRNPSAGINENSLRQGLRNGNWIAVSGEDDPPDYPVNVGIAPFPQYHLQITVPTPLGPSSSIPVIIRYIIASSKNVAISGCSWQFQGGVPSKPSIPPGDEVIIYIHGEGSRAEEALDFIPALFSVGAGVGRSFTVIAFDQPSCGYSTMVPHLSVAPMPLTSGVSGVIDTSPFSGSPILDFIETGILTFVEKLVLPFGNPITAVVGGSLGGHMALRLAATQKDWVRNVIAWSPASVMEHDFSVEGVSISQRVLTDPVLAGRATEQEAAGLRPDFFRTVWDQDTANVAAQYGPKVAAVAAALIAGGFITNVLGIIAATDVSVALLGLTPVPAQPLMWYRDDWPSGAPAVQLAPWGSNAVVGPAKAIYIQETRRDRREVYNADFRRWHWRICEEMIGYKFDSLVPQMNKPLLLMVGEKDDYPDVHFFSHVKAFAQSFKPLSPKRFSKCLTVSDTGHSIHNERPYFLANQLVAFAPRP